MARVATVAYESPKSLERAIAKGMRAAKPLKWHRQGEAQVAAGTRGSYQVSRRPPDRRHGVLPWVVIASGNQLPRGFDTQGDAKKFAAYYDSGNCGPDGRPLAAAAEHGDPYERKVCDLLRKMGSPSPEDDVRRSEKFIAGVKPLGDPDTAAMIIYATLHHAHPHHAAFAAKEAPTREEWEVVVMSVPENLRKSIGSMAPGGASVVGNSLTLHGFYDDEKAAQVARAVTQKYGLLATSGPKRWAVAAETGASEDAIRWWLVVYTDRKGERGETYVRARSSDDALRQAIDEADIDASQNVKAIPLKRGAAPHLAEGSAEANDSCQPFTRVERDPQKFSACMARARTIGPIDNSKAIYELVRGDIEKLDEEHFYVMCVDFRGQLRDYFEIAKGQRHRVGVDIEDIISAVILSKCDGFALAHNHPSGVPTPSDADKDLTSRVLDAARVACPNVAFIDHVVVGQGRYHSFADHGTRPFRR